MPNETLAAALEHHRAGRAAQAQTLYRQVLSESPENADALHLLGQLRQDAGDAAGAVELIARAVVAKPQVGELRLSLARALAQLGRPDHALAAASEAVRLKPDFVEAHTLAAQLHRQRGDAAAAETAARAAIKYDEHFAPAWHELGIALQQSGRQDEALAAYEATLKIQPGFVEAINNLAVLQRESGDAEMSRATCERALALRPDSARALMNLGSALFDLRRPGDAVEAFDRAISLSPPFAAQVHVNKALALLLDGRLAEGWLEFEHRWSLPGSALTSQLASIPRWDGSPLEGKTILLWAEQGFGDTILIARYAEIACKKFGGRVLVACQKPLRALLENMPGVSGPARWEKLDEISVQCPLMSVPHVTQATATFAEIPRDVPYLIPDTQRVAHWRDRFSERGGRLHVGFAWSANRATADGAKRSVPAEMLRPIAFAPNVRGFSLQKDWGAESAIELGLTDWTAELHDFAETAALIDQLDLVISIDSAVCHLAGAMGKPVWTLLPKASSWQWFLDRDDSPWYPTMRLFRQERAGDWDAVIAKVSDALAGMMRGGCV